VVLLAGAGCGFEVQTNQPYTPAMGVNADAGPASAVKIRNLLIISRTPGQGFLSMTLTSSRQDALVGVSGTSIKADGSEGAPLRANVAQPVELGPGALVVITKVRPLTVQSPDLVPGTSARVTLQFRETGEVSMLVPVYQDQEEFETVTPSPAPPG